MKQACLNRSAKIDEKKSRYPDRTEVTIDRLSMQIFRLTSDSDIAVDGRPKPESFTDKGLSLVAIGGGLLPISIEDIVEKSTRFTGAWHLPLEFFPESDFQIRHDPFPMERASGEATEPPLNHIQVFCDKEPGLVIKCLTDGHWQVLPTRLLPPNYSSRYDKIKWNK